MMEHYATHISTRIFIRIFFMSNFHTESVELETPAGDTSQQDDLNRRCNITFEINPNAESIEVHKITAISRSILITGNIFIYFCANTVGYIWPHLLNPSEI
jgi:hypothetical protein